MHKDFTSIINSTENKKVSCEKENNFNKNSNDDEKFIHKEEEEKVWQKKKFDSSIGDQL